MRARRVHSSVQDMQKGEWRSFGDMAIVCCPKCGTKHVISKEAAGISGTVMFGCVNVHCGTSGVLEMTNFNEPEPVAKRAKARKA